MENVLKNVGEFTTNMLDNSTEKNGKVGKFSMGRTEDVTWLVGKVLRKMPCGKKKEQLKRPLKYL